MVAVVPPLDHIYLYGAEPLPATVTTALPRAMAQVSLTALALVAIALVVEVSVKVWVAVQPFLSVILTVYEPDERLPAEAVVSPLFQLYLYGAVPFAGVTEIEPLEEVQTG